MSALKTIIAFSLLLACSSRTSPKIAIYDNTLYGDITDGRPDKDTLSSTMDSSGRITGKGKVAVAGTEISLLKTGLCHGSNRLDRCCEHL